MRRVLIRGAAATAFVAAGLALLAGPATAAPAVRVQFFRNCDEAKEAGFADIRLGDDAYGAHLDRDGDGIACEEGEGVSAPQAQGVPDQTTPTTMPAPTTAPTTAPAPTAAPPVAPPPPEVAGATEERLAETGVSWTTPLVAALALFLFLAGNWFTKAGYEHQRWLPGRQSHTRFTVERARQRRR